MHLHSLGYQTDLIFPRFDGIILDRGDYLVIQTPTNSLVTTRPGHAAILGAGPDLSGFGNLTGLCSDIC